MSSGYAITNALAGLADTAFTWSSAFTTGRTRLNDGLQDEVAAGSSSAQASGQTLTVDLGAATAIVGIALLNHNLATGACTVAVTSDDNSGFASPTTRKSATTINTSAPYDKDTILQFTSASERYWRLTFAHSGTKIINIGELLFFTSITTLTRQTIYGAGESERYVQNRVVSMTGHQRASLLAGPIRTKRLPYKDLRATTERDELMTMWRACRGGVSNLLFIDEIDSTTSAGDAESQRCLWGKLQPEVSWTENDFQLFDVDAFVLVGQGREAGA